MYVVWEEVKDFIRRKMSKYFFNFLKWIENGFCKL